MANGNLIQEVATTLEKTSKTVIKWGLSNAISYDIAKTKAILFLPTRNKKVKQDISEIQLTIREQEIKFNNQLT